MFSIIRKLYFLNVLLIKLKGGGSLVGVNDGDQRSQIRVLLGAVFKFQVKLFKKNALPKKKNLTQGYKLSPLGISYDSPPYKP